MERLQVDVSVHEFLALHQSLIYNLNSFLFVDQGTYLPKSLVKLLLELLGHKRLLHAKEEGMELSVFLN